VKPSNNGQLLNYSWSVVIFGMYCQFKTIDSEGWQIAIHTRTTVKLQSTAMEGFHSYLNQCYQILQQFSCSSDVLQKVTVFGKCWAETLYSVVKSLMDVIWIEDIAAQQDVVCWDIQSVKSWKIIRWSYLKLENGKHLEQIQKINRIEVDH